MSVSDRVHEIDGLRWTMMSPSEIMKAGGAGDKDYDGIRIFRDDGATVEIPELSSGTMCDRRMGPVSPLERCGTCGEFGYRCPGHFGYIQLACPVLLSHFIPFIRDLLRRICTTPHCTAILQRTSRRNVPCLTCGVTLPHIVGHAEGFALRRVDRRDEEILNAEGLWDLLRRKPAEVWRALGYDPEVSHPAWTLMTVLPVIPACIRPYSYTKGKLTAHDLTVQYSKVIAANCDARSASENDLPSLAVREAERKLREAVQSLFDSSKVVRKDGRIQRQVTQVSQNTMIALLTRKEGYFRKVVQGMRCNHTLRTVITADPWMNVDEIGVPFSVAWKLTTPEPVTEDNLSDMRRMILDNTMSRFHIAVRTNRVVKKVRKANGEEYVVDKEFDPKLVADDLAPGDVVMRPLRDGDVVVVNRQPTLHKGSMMAHRAKLMGGLTMRLPMPCCTPYNADFDGDEMNLHVPQSLAARIEAAELMSVTRNFISPQDNRTRIPIIYDALLLANRMTQPYTFVSEEELMQLAMVIPPETLEPHRLPHPTCFLPRREGRYRRAVWTGKAVVSTMFPRELDYEGRGGLVIRGGYIVCGELSKSSLGATHNGLIQAIHNEFGRFECARFVSHIQFLVNTWGKRYGFSLSVSNGFFAKREELMETVAATISTVSGLTEPNRLAVLNRARDDADKLPMDELSGKGPHPVGDDGKPILPLLTHRTENAVYAMFKAGSKGTSHNYIQTVALLGQQSLFGKRIPKMMNGGRRCLPHFRLDDDGPAARGFVQSSFNRGLGVLECYFHSIGGRQGVVDTGLKVSNSGYIARKLMKMLECVTVAYDGTVRRNRDNIIQFTFGDDGFQCEAYRRSEIGEIPPYVPREGLDEERRVVEDSHAFVRAYAERMKNARADVNLPILFDEVERGAKRVHERPDTSPLLDDWHGLDFRALDEAEKAAGPDVARLNRERDGAWIHRRLRRTVMECWEFEPAASDARVALKSGKIPKDFHHLGPRLLVSLLFSHYNSHVVTTTKPTWTRLRFECFLRVFKDKYRAAKIDANEAVGPVAAQSLSEPTTQMTLNTCESPRRLPAFLKMRH